ncbi:MAG TPA: alpha-galactosidase, partial [Chloroflexota bacterium]|nr:alpha-galactosidase [Chloroflexota bacterium]
RRSVADYRTSDGVGGATVAVTAATSHPSLIYEVSSNGLAPEGFTFFTPGSGGLDLPGPVDLFTLLSVGVVQRTISPGDAPLSIPLPAGGPLLVWSAGAQHGYVLSLLDETVGRGVLYLAYPEDGRFELSAEVRPRAAEPDSAPRLYVQRVETPEPGPAFADYRAVLDRIAPSPDVPPSFRQMWNSWYVYGGDVDENALRAQVDTIADRFGDLGPWTITIDAGWYRAGDDPDGELGLVDSDKFPSGMRDLIDYAHARGVAVVLYASAPWVDTHPDADWWVVLRGFVRDHPDWLIPIEEDDEGGTYVYDLANPDVRDYFEDLARRFVVDFDADGVALDMVGVIGRDGGPFRDETVPLEDLLSVASTPGVAQTMAVYRLMWSALTRHDPDAWIEGNYAAPPLARSYARTWHLADDYPAFSHPFPYAGLVEQITHAILGQQLQGRRPNLGYIFGGDDYAEIQRQWLAAAVAMQAEVVVSVDLTTLPSRTERMYREYLAALRPFAERPIFGSGVPPETFATTIDGTTYLGLLNLARWPRTMTVDLTAYGVAPTGTVVAFDPETRRAFTSGADLTTTVPARHLRLLALRRAPGVLWGDRSWSVGPGGALDIHVQPAPVDSGQLWVYAPGVAIVSVDGSDTAGSRMDDGNGVLTVRVPDGGAHDIRVALASPSTPF